MNGPRALYFMIISTKPIIHYIDDKRSMVICCESGSEKHGRLILASRLGLVIAGKFPKIAQTALKTIQENSPFVNGYWIYLFTPSKNNRIGILQNQSRVNQPDWMLLKAALIGLSFYAIEHPGRRFRIEMDQTPPLNMHYPDNIIFHME
jgi:hypothetical protein